MSIETRAINLTLPYPPSVNAYWRVWDGRILLSKRGREYRKRAEACVLMAGCPSIGKARAHVDIRAYPPDRRVRDLDNIRKAVNDALEACGVVENDSQIKRDSGEMFDPDKANPRIEITIEPDPRHAALDELVAEGQARGEYGTETQP